jgi:hypothetical protein
MEFFSSCPPCVEVFFINKQLITLALGNFPVGTGALLLSRRVDRRLDQ